MFNMKRHNRPAALRIARGFTLLELLVAVAITAIMILIFGGIITRTRAVVHGAQNIARANTMASAIIRHIRTDLSNVSKMGFLYLQKHATATLGDEMALTTAGPTPSRMDGIDNPTDAGTVGDGALIVYRIRTNGADTAPTSGDPILFCRIRWVLSKSRKDLTNQSDCCNLDNFASLQIKSVTDIRTLIADLAFYYAASGQNLTYPPVTIADVKQRWAVVTDNVVAGSFQIEYRRRGDTTWQTPTGTGDLWTRHDLTDWPELVKIKFKLIPSEGAEPIEYEVIATVGL